MISCVLLEGYACTEEMLEEKKMKVEANIQEDAPIVKSIFSSCVFFSRIDETNNLITHQYVLKRQRQREIESGENQLKRLNLRAVERGFFLQINSHLYDNKKG